MEQTVVLTGSIRGPGFGLAEDFLERRHQVVLNGTTEEGTARAVENLLRFGRRGYGAAGGCRHKACC